MKRLIAALQGLQLLPMLRLMRGHMLVFWITVGLGILQLALGIAIAGLGAWLVGLVGIGASWADIARPFWILLACVLVAAITSWSEMWLAHDLAYRVLASIRNALFEALRLRSPGSLERERTGDVVSTVMADVETLEWFYAHTVGAFVACTLVPLGALLLLGSFEPLVPLLLLPFLLAQAIVPLWLAKYARKQGSEVRKQLSLVNANVIDLVQGLREIVCFGAQKRMQQKLDHLNRKYVTKQARYGLRAGLENAASATVAALGMITTLIISAHAVNQGRLQPENFPALVILAGAVFGPVTSLAVMVSQMGLISGAAGRVFKLLDSEDRLDNDGVRAENKVSSFEVSFENVHFRYEPTRPPALNGLSLQIEQGESVALAGLSGAGKTTCAKLLLRFFDPESGQVRIGGLALNTLTEKELRRQITWVPQDIFLFNLTIAENIALANPEASRTEIILAARMATAHDFISAMPEAYDTKVGDRGMQLSGGQRQRIAVARAILRKTPIVIFDEAASNLDNESEKALQVALQNLREGRTIITIAHRLSTLEAADRVIVIENGRVVETGPPQTLLAQEGSFKQLVQAQFQSKMQKGDKLCHS